MTDFPRDKLEAVFGFQPEAQARPGCTMLVVSLDFEGLSRFFEHQENLGESARSALKCLFTSPSESSRVFLNLVLDPGKSLPLVLLEADCPGDRVLPDFSRVWPYAAWWQQELAESSGIRFDRTPGMEGISWRLI